MKSNLARILPPARAQRKRERTRDGLVAAAEELFAKHGPDAVSIDEITAAADVAKGTFYTHFSDKDDLARALARSVRLELEDQVTRVNSGISDPGIRMANGLACYLSFAVHQPTRARTLSRLLSGAANPEAPINAGLRNDVLSGLTAGRFDVPSVNAAVLTAIGVCGAAIAYLVETPGARGQTTACETVAIVLRGFGIKPAEAKRLAENAVAQAFAVQQREGKRS
jgi:AcrR family transcriptional regulator